jgi:hypothetical protein
MMRLLLFALSLFMALPAANADVRVGVAISTPNLSIGINIPSYPRLALIPGYPVYYAPYLNSNYFFYDGMYWVFYGDNWYASAWFNGPWQLVDRFDVPYFILRIPVRYYRSPPPYFRGWRVDAPPHWHDRWGHEWAERHRGWDRWDRRAPPAAAPLPRYQRDYRGPRYPEAAQEQRSLRDQNYRYQPRDPATQPFYRHERGPDRRQDGPGRQERGQDRRQDDRGHGPR